MTAELNHVIRGLSNREMNSIRYIVEVAKKEGIDLSDLAILLKVSQHEEIKEEVRLDGYSH